MAKPATVKRFWKDVAVAEADGGFRIELDGRPIRTQGGSPQIVPTRGLAEAMAGEWRRQGIEVDPRAFPLRDLADYAIDHVRTERESVIDKLLGYAETDTLCYRADPDEPLYRRQYEIWEPLVTAMEAREGIALNRVSGVIHRAQPRGGFRRVRAVDHAADARQANAVAGFEGGK